MFSMLGGSKSKKDAKASSVAGGTDADVMNSLDSFHLEADPELRDVSIEVEEDEYGNASLDVDINAENKGDEEENEDRSATTGIAIASMPVSAPVAPLSPADKKQKRGSIFDTFKSTMSQVANLTASADLSPDTSYMRIKDPRLTAIGKQMRQLELDCIRNNDNIKRLDKE